MSTLAPICSLPKETIDHVFDHLVDDPPSLKNFYLVSSTCAQKVNSYLEGLWIKIKNHPPLGIVNVSREIAIIDSRNLSYLGRFEKLSEVFRSFFFGKLLVIFLLNNLQAYNKGSQIQIFVKHGKE